MRSSEFKINTHTDGAQFFPSVTSLSDGGVVVTWASVQSEYIRATDTYGQLYDMLTLGSPTGSEFQINTYTRSDQWLPSIASLSDGGFVVTWTYYSCSTACLFPH